MFLRTHAGAVTTEREQNILAGVIDSAYYNGLESALLTAKEVYRALHIGQCKIISGAAGVLSEEAVGGKCKCFLCQIDEILSEVADSDKQNLRFLSGFYGKLPVPDGGDHAGEGGD
jgi:hypothetical protein